MSYSEYCSLPQSPCSNPRDLWLCYVTTWKRGIEVADTTKVNDLLRWPWNVESTLDYPGDPSAATCRIWGQSSLMWEEFHPDLLDLEIEEGATAKERELPHRKPETAERFSSPTPEGMQPYQYLVLAQWDVCQMSSLKKTLIVLTLPYIINLLF